MTTPLNLIMTIVLNLVMTILLNLMITQYFDNQHYTIFPNI